MNNGTNIITSKMIVSSEAQSNESFYLKKSQQLLQTIRQTTLEAAETVTKFDIQTGSDKICFSTVANNFARDLEYILNNLQRIMIDNHKKGDNNDSLNKAVQAFSTFVYSIQLAFGHDFNKLKLEIINALKNLDSKLDPLVDMVQEHSPYTSKWEFTSILDYLYIAIKKVKVRTQWEHLDPTELNKTLADISKDIVVAARNFKDKPDTVDYYRRTAHEGVEGILRVVEELDIEMDCYDNNSRDLVSKVTAKLAASILDYDKPSRTLNNMSELSLIANVCALSLHPAIREVLGILSSEKSSDFNDNFKNFIKNAVVNLLGVSIKFARDCERVSEY